MKHFLSEPAVWKTTSEFVTPNGEISNSKGESVISISETEIINESWAQIGDVKRINTYKLIPVSSGEFRYESFNPELGKQIGVYNIDRNTIFSKFEVEATSLNGYEIIRRENDVCYAQGALYDGNKLLNTWSAILSKLR
ncbi:MAG: hypothetical protein LIP01_01770 [Tannerellaceae bacterium]|nr:hypothetical protein [Tannerellaceae bacterium]